jgi:hypothetical protein
LRFFRTLLLSFAALPLTAIFASASTVTINFTGLPSNTEHGTYNGFVSGSIDGLLFDNLICDDYIHTTYVPSGNLRYVVADINALPQTRFVGPDAQEYYQQAAILLYGLEHLSAVNSSLSRSTQLTVGDIQYALWNIFTPGSGATSHSGLVLSLLNASTPGLPAASQIYSELRIYTPTAEFASNQEFLQLLLTPVNSQAHNDFSEGTVPEPGTLALAIGGLLIGIGIAAKRCLRNTASHQT